MRRRQVPDHLWEPCPQCGASPGVPCLDRRTLVPDPDTGEAKPRFLSWVHASRPTRDAQRPRAGVPGAAG